LPNEFHWDQSSGRVVPGNATKSAGQKPRRSSVLSPWYLISRLAMMVIVLAAISLIYLSVRTRASDPMAAARATDAAATGDNSVGSKAYSLVSPADATLLPPELVVASEIDATPTPAHTIVTTPAAATLCGDKEGKVIGDKVKSVVLGVTLPVDVYVPPCYDPSKYAYPTLYLIQGLGYVRGQWADDGVAIVADRGILSGRLPPFIMVMPANDSMSGSASRFVYTSRGTKSWEGFIVNELIPIMDSRYSTWGNRDGRAIGGISRGGYWALEIAFMHTNLFSAAGGHSPAITSDYLVGTPDDFSMLDLVRLTDSLKTLRIFLDAGLGDVTQTGVYQLASELGAKKIPYVGRVGTGKHDDVYWSSQLDNYLAFYAATWPVQPQAK
jgi:enterochelin esterase-like enzyme